MLAEILSYRTYPTRRASSSRYRFLVAGFHLLVVYWVSNAYFPLQGLSVGKVVISALLLLATLCFALQIILGAKRSRFAKIDFPSSFLLISLLIWSMVTIARGVTLDTGRLFTLLAHPKIGGLVWLLPFAVYIGRQPGVFGALFPAFRVHAVAGIVLIVWTIIDVGYRNTTPNESASSIGVILLYAAPVVLLTGTGRRRDRWLYFLGLGLVTITHFLYVNRVLFAETITILLLALALGRVRDFKKVTFRLLSLVIVSLPLIFLAANYALPSLSKEWFIDTRTFLWLEVIDEFGRMDWLIGRGSLGIYFSPYFFNSSRMGLEGDSMFRQVIEVGYLHIVFKAGLIGVILYFTIILRAVYKSMFIPDRRLGVGLALLLAAHLFELMIIGSPTFQPSRVLLWMMVGFALSAPNKRFWR